jgi:choline dehydrogenase-like flavoprotein
MATEFDYVIVGGGSAGCVLAARLSEDPGVKVALIEAGPPDSSVLIHCPAGLALLAKNGQANWAFQTVPQPGLNGRRGYQPRGKVLGGSSSVNAMIYARGHRSDYNHWEALGNPGWGWDDVLPYFKRAEHNERGADEFHGTGGPLNVSDFPEEHPVSAAIVDACVEAGIPYKKDLNDGNQEGVSFFQMTAKNGRRHSAAVA